ncbi:hypothetical protein DES38_1081, partial [Streptohalobacillus salinus]
AVHFLFLRIKNTPNKVVEFLLFLLSTLLGAYQYILVTSFLLTIQIKRFTFY